MKSPIESAKDFEKENMSWASDCARQKLEKHGQEVWEFFLSGESGKLYYAKNVVDRWKELALGNENE